MILSRIHFSGNLLKAFTFTLAFAILCFPLVHLHPESLHIHTGELVVESHSGVIEFCFFDHDEDEEISRAEGKLSSSLTCFDADDCTSEVNLVADRNSDEGWEKALNCTSCTLIAGHERKIVYAEKKKALRKQFQANLRLRSPPAGSFSV